MNRIARRSAAEAAEALLEAGRTQPVLNYDVELGLARHHHWLRSEAPLPEWASAGAGVAAKSLVPIVTKTVVSALLIGALAVAAWHARGRPQPSAAPARLGAERPPDVAPSARDLTASEEWSAPRPIPVPDRGLHDEQPEHRVVRADARDKRTNRVARAHKGLASARADGVLPGAEPAAARGEPAALATAEASEARATQPEVAAAPESKPISAATEARPEPAARAQAPDDLVEMQQVAKAEKLLERSPERALALVRQGDQRFASGYFQQERAYIAIMALIQLGRIDEARARAASFAKQFPARPYGARIRSALDAAK